LFRVGSSANLLHDPSSPKLDLVLSVTPVGLHNRNTPVSRRVCFAIHCILSISICLVLVRLHCVVQWRACFALSSPLLHANLFCFDVQFASSCRKRGLRSEKNTTATQRCACFAIYVAMRRKTPLQRSGVLVLRFMVLCSVVGFLGILSLFWSLYRALNTQ